MIILYVELLHLNANAERPSPIAMYFEMFAFVWIAYYTYAIQE